MKVCITGGCGFIGTNLMLYFSETEPDTQVVLLDTAIPTVELPDNVSYVYGDIRNLASLIRVFEDCDEVYNLAGILGTSELIPISSLACEVNVVGANNVLDAARFTSVKRVYNVSKPHFDWYNENVYTLTKHSGELLGQLYQDKYGMEVSTVRWLNAVGPHQHLYPVRKLVPAMVLFGMYDLPFEIYGDGTQTIDPIDVRDLCRFTIYVCRNLGTYKGVVDLGSGSAINCNDTADLIREVLIEKGCDTQSQRVNIPMRPGEKEGVNLVADMTFWNELGMYPEYSFRDSIETVIDYMLTLPKNHLDNAIKFYKG